MKNTFSPFRFFNNKFLLVLFAVCCILLTGCKKQDYSTFPQDTVLKWEMKDGRSIYLIRENDSTDMKGYGFVYSGKAVVDLFLFNATDSGTIFFEKDDRVWQAKSKIRGRKKSLRVSSLNLPDMGIDEQNISFSSVKAYGSRYLCEGKRYYDVLFDTIDSSKNIEYGKAVGHYTSQKTDTLSHGDTKALRQLIVKDLGVSVKKEKELPLLLDFYQPATDSMNKRPVFLFIHGGAFYFGDKENSLQESITKNLVEKGFVLFSMNYRLGEGLIGFDKTERTIFRGVQDARAAIRYIIEYQEKFGIDPNQIYIGGSSAGAIISLATAFMDENEIYRSANNKFLHKKMGNLNSVGNHYEHEYHIAGVVSLWGAVSRLDLIDKRNADIPVLLVHGTHDQIVPDTMGLPFQGKLESKIYDRMSTNWCLYGSYSIYRYMKKMGMEATYIPLFGYGHEPQVNPDGSYNQNMDIINEEMNRFLYRNVLKHYFPHELSGIEKVSKEDAAPVYSMPDIGPRNARWGIEGGFILDKQDNEMKVVWYNTADKRKIKVCATDENDITWQKELSVDISQ